MQEFTSQLSIPSDDLDAIIERNQHSDYERIKRFYDNEHGRAGWVVKHRKTDKLYFIETDNVDSWDEGSLSYDADEVKIFEVTEIQITSYSVAPKGVRVQIERKEW